MEKIIKGTFYLKSGACIEDKVESPKVFGSAENYIKSLRLEIRANRNSHIEFGDSVIRINDISAATFKVE